jgi:hypothetical protein
MGYILGTLGWVVVHEDDGDSNCGLGIMTKKIIVAACGGEIKSRPAYASSE